MNNPLDVSPKGKQGTTRGKEKRELKHARFWDADGNRKWAFLTFNLSSHNHIHIAKYLFSFRGEKYKNLGDNTALAREMFSSGCRPRLKNAPA